MVQVRRESRVCPECGNRLLPLERRCPRCNARTPLSVANGDTVSEHGHRTAPQPGRSPPATRLQQQSSSDEVDLSLQYVALTPDGRTVLCHAISARPADWEQRFVPGAVLHGRYELAREIGRGGMGTVFLGVDRRLARPVAVKVISTTSGRRVEDVERVREEFFREEARLGANLTHPHIAMVYDFGTWGDAPFTVLEYVEGETLREFLVRRRRLSIPEVWQFLGPIALALDFAHGRGVVHRDLKPENIRLTPAGHYKILDLGLAREYNRQQDWRFMGTPAYAAPEQAAELPADGRTDQYALALVVYEMLTGRRAFQASNPWEMLRLQREAEPADARAWMPGLPEGLWHALQRALSKDPNRRFPTCREFAKAAGCQFLHEGRERPQAVLDVEALSLEWNTLFRPRWQRLGLTADALWWNDDGDITRYPFDCLASFRKRWRGRSLELSLRSRDQESNPSFLWRRVADGNEYYEQLCQLLRHRLEGQPANSNTDNIDWTHETVPLLSQRPNVPCQIVGPIEVDAIGGRQAQASLQLRAAVQGAQAVFQVETKTLPAAARTSNKLLPWRRSWTARQRAPSHRATGVAVRLVDPRGRREVYVRWADEECGRLGRGILVFSVLVGVLLLLQNALLARLLSVPASWLSAATVLQWLGPAWLGVGLWRMRWPQCLNAAHLSLLLCSLAPVACGLCALLAVFSDVNIRPTVSSQLARIMISWLNPVQFLCIPFASRLSGRADRLDNLCRSLVAERAESEADGGTTTESWSMIFTQAMGVAYVLLACWSIFRALDLLSILNQWQMAE